MRSIWILTFGQCTGSLAAAALLRNRYSRYSAIVSNSRNWADALEAHYGVLGFIYYGCRIFAKTFLATLVYLVNVLHNLSIFWKNPTRSPLFHSAHLLILGNFQAKMIFIAVFLENSNQHGLIPSCMFTNFGIFLHPIHSVPTSSVHSFTTIWARGLNHNGSFEDLFNTCLEPEAKEHGMVFQGNHMQSNYP